jgi:hypothetical protein
VSRRQCKAAFCCPILAFVALLGCDDEKAPPAREPAECRNDAGSSFNPATAGTIEGHVTWQGDTPVVAPFEIPPNPLAGEVFHQKQVRTNPNVPIINSRTGGVANAVVFLRNVDPRQSRAWDHPPVRVEQRGCRFHVVQGDVDSPFGLVRRGDNVDMVSRERCFHSLHADGAAFFSLTFPDPDEPLSRRFKERGIVELTSAAGYYWMRAYLFVDEHPYYTRTNAEGRFVISQVPPGRYELVCWMPNWRKARHERDPESGMIVRLFFEPALESSRHVIMSPGGVYDLHLVISARTEPGRSPD